MNIFGVGLPEMMLILGIALLIFGPKKLPEIGRSLGKAIRGFQEAADEFQSEFKREADQLDNSVKMKAQLEPEDQQTQTPPTESASATTQDTSKA
ncbi:MAG: TatA/E family twin arginine-targeting protein translocase [Kamptonema sp. SIO4C4]|nr:TatA/E family twin arginine-targeting protein translocase [Kamptonema sp. SIO4C4]